MPGVDDTLYIYIILYQNKDLQRTLKCIKRTIAIGINSVHYPYSKSKVDATVLYSK